MQKVVSSTSQVRITLSQKIRYFFGISKAVQTVISREGQSIIITPQLAFADLAGSLKTKIKLSDDELKQARAEFNKTWASNS